MNPLPTSLAMFGLPGGTEWIVIAILGLLIFGKRLPEVGKSLGRSIVEFKKGLRGIEDDMDKAVEGNQAEMLPPPSPEDDTASVQSQDTTRPQADAATRETVSQTNPTDADS